MAEKFKAISKRQNTLQQIAMSLLLLTNAML